MTLGRRCFLLGSVALVAPWRLALAARGRVYVFAVTSVRPHVLQKLLGQALPGLEVRVFGRVGDFSRALDETPPDAAIALAPVLEALGRKPEIQGTLSGDASEPYVVVSEHPLRHEQLASATLGCIDFVGRKKLPSFVAQVLGLPKPPEVQRVTKIEDLLQLLQFRRADAILLPQRFLPDIRALTKMSFAVLRPEQARVRRTAMTFPGNRHAVERALSSLPRNVLAHLGVDAWTR